MNIQDDIKTLYNYEAFARFMKMVHQLREESIEELHEATSEQHTTNLRTNNHI